jgi:hypothetical protein
VRILTWHVHGNYLWYLAHVPHEWVVPVRPGRPPGYAGRAGVLPWPDNVVEVPAEDVPTLDLDAVLYQSHRNWLVDRPEILTPEQQALPRAFLEHDPPRESPTDSRHPVDDPAVWIVHVTHFNRLMWDCGPNPTAVIEHGVTVPGAVRWSGDLARGAVVVNGLARRGRRLGADVFTEVRRRVPLDLAGMESERLGGLGEVPNPAVPAFLARYRFLFNPIRYTSLGLAVCEALAVGVPVVGLATTEMATVVRNGVNGYVATDVDTLVTAMRRLLADRDEAAALSRGARATAIERFGIDRFAADWEALLSAVVAGSPVSAPAAGA